MLSKCKQGQHGNIDCDRTPLKGEDYCIYHLPCALRARIEHLEMQVKTFKNDYWFMINLIERYGSDKDQTLKDCLERMKFRQPMFKDNLEAGG